MLRNYFTATTISFFLLISSIAFGASNVILLKSRTISTENNFSERIHDAVDPSEVFHGNYFRLIQFNKVLSAAERSQIEATGLKFDGYIPNNTYNVSIPSGYNLSALQQYDARTIVNLLPQDKMSNQLRLGNIDDRCRNKDGSVNFTLVYYGNLSPQLVKQELVIRGCSILESFDESAQVSVSMNENLWITIAGCSFIKHIEPLFPSTPDDTKGRSLHRSNAINTEYGAGLHYDGAGVSVALADDGEVGPHIDYSGRMINTFNTGAGGSHGDMTSGICVGAGNLDPTIRGMATGSTIYIFDIGTYPPDTLGDSYPQVVNAAQNYDDYGTVVVSTSYSSGACNDYDAFAAMTDRIFHNLPQILPVWSAGNNQGGDCGYGAGGQWGNITGGFKQGKNPIAVANLDAHEVIDNSSSHGPASDGRIKPDISANGKDQLSLAENDTFQVGGGTSAACPSIAGVTAQCYQAYRQIMAEPNPDAALIKGCLLNSAWDIGTPGPDYAFGYGRVDGLRAVETIEEQRFIIDSMPNSGSKAFSLMVPSSTKQMKVMLIWSDPQADPNSFKALINDLDLEIIDPSMQYFKPWVLDPTPIAANLAQPAVRRVDTLNNIEQVTIDNPGAGNYTIAISGSSVPVGVQKYFIVYEFWNDNIKLTYPAGGEGFVPNEVEVLRWNAFDNTGNFAIDYSTNNGTTWNTVGTVPGSARQYDWQIPNNVSGNCLVRISRGASSDVNDAPFSIVGVPSNLEVTWQCVDSLKLTWDAVPGATGYEASMLGAMYMDSMGTSNTNEIILHNINSNNTNWFSVRALTASAKGRRALAIKKLPGLLNCTLAQDMALSSILPASGNFNGCETGLDSIQITANITNTGFSSATGFDLSYSINSGNPVTETYSGVLNFGQSDDFTFTTLADLSAGGIFTIDVAVNMAGDQYTLNNNQASTVIVGSAAMAPVTEDFQSMTFPPLYWRTINSNQTMMWSSMSAVGSNGQNTYAAVFDNCGYNSNGAEDALCTQLYDISGLTNPALTFDVSYREYQGYTDALRIDVSTNCGVSFLPSTYYKQSPQLTTVPSGVGCYNPTAAADWRNDALDLSPYAGQNIILKFVNIGGYGNLLFIDNVNVSNYILNAPGEAISMPQISVYPNPSAAQFFAEMKNIPGTNLTMKILDASGRVVRENILKNSGLVQTTIDLSNQHPGIYILEVSSDEKIYHLILTKL
jgi:hypothetical protein